MSEKEMHISEGIKIPQFGNLKKKNLFPDDWGVKIISDT